jgi:shikimate kinase
MNNKCVVLLGFSTTGKSSALRELNAWNLTILDSDSEISKEYGNHIYNIFINKTNGSDRTEALRIIEEGESEFLRLAPAIIEQKNLNSIMAAGPALPSRKEWAEFVRIMKADSDCLFIYLEKSAEDVYEGLKTRRRNHLNEASINAHENFGCWDEDVITEKDGTSWKPILDDDRALENIRKNMSYLVDIYTRYADRTVSWASRQKDDGLLISIIKNHLCI